MGFPQNFIEDSTVSETGNWNVAQSYSEGIIMGQLRYIRQLQTVAEIGNLDPSDTMGMDENSIRFEALKRLIQALKQLISDTKFALKNKDQRKEFLEYYEEIQKYKKNLKVVYKVQKNNVRKTQSFELTEHFDKFIDNLDTIKMALYEIINKNDLIYPTKEEFDPKEFKRRMIERATTRG